MIDNWGGDWGVYPNMGLTDPEPDGAMDEKVGENDFRKTIKKYLELDPMVIGTCCGSTPNHIETISNMIQGK